MIKASSVVRINKSKIGTLTRATKVALEQTAEALHTEIVQAQVMPFDTGNLQNESTAIDNSEISVGKVSIVTSTPYARRLYFHPEYNFSKKENPNAKGEWYEDWLQGGEKADFARKAYIKLYKKLGGV